MVIYPHGIAITGSIASGKSSVVNILKSRGFEVIDADLIAHSVLNEQKAAVSARFEGILDENGEIDRKKLGQIVFSDSAKRALLEEILGPKIRQNIEQIASILEAKKRLFFADIPLYFEKNYSGFAGVCAVFCAPKIQIKRLINRDKIDKIAAQNKINAQMSGEQKAKMADFVIDNSASFKDLEAGTGRFIAWALNRVSVKFS